MRAADLLQKVLERKADGELPVPSYDNMHTPDNHVGKKNMKTVKNPEKGLDTKRDEHPTAEVGTPGKESRSMEGPGTTPKKMSEEQINELDVSANALVTSLNLRYDGANERLLVNHPSGPSRGKSFYLPITRFKLENALKNPGYLASPLSFYTDALKQSQGGPARQMQTDVGEDVGDSANADSSTPTGGNGGRRRHAYLLAAEEMIDDDEELIYDVAISHGQKVGNVKGMKWFKDAVADWLEKEEYPVAMESIKIKENDEEPTLEIWWNGGHGWEEVDTAKDKKEANYLIGEYRMAYGGGQFKTKRIKKAANEAAGEPANPTVSKMSPSHSATVRTKQPDEPTNKGEPGKIKKKEKRASADGRMDANPVSVVDFKGGSNEHKSMKKMHEALSDLEDFVGRKLDINLGSKKKLSENDDNLLRSYVGTALWSSNDDNGEPMDDRFSIDDFAPETLQKMNQDIAKFLQVAEPLLAQAEERRYNLDRAMHDFWLTRNGHGVGFWDRTELEEGGLGDKLTKISQKFGEASLYVGDNNKIYQFSG